MCSFPILWELLYWWKIRKTSSKNINLFIYMAFWMNVIWTLNLGACLNKNVDITFSAHNAFLE